MVTIHMQQALRLGAGRTGAGVAKSAGGGVTLRFLGRIRLLFNPLCVEAAHRQTAW